MTEFTSEIDTSGLSCPLPILKSKKALKALNIGDILRVISTDPGSEKDMASWARVTGQDLLSFEMVDGKYIFFVKRLK